ncbi:MAG: phosphoribosylformylglycinamidine synthase [Treponema sp.]|jgi:phosphoribosylformylglycinamidine synthase|nr:phosphoribosylformylglycinamidine synthase [Treponema sp.]
MVGIDDKAKVRRVFVEKMSGFDVEARRLADELTGFLGRRFPELARLKKLRILHRYDAAHLDADQFALAAVSVFSEPQCDRLYYGEDLRAAGACVKGDAYSKGASGSIREECSEAVFERYLGIEYASGQYDQRADSAEQCIELVSGVKPIVKCAVFYIFETKVEPLSDAALDAVKQYLINPVDSREASAAMPASLEDEETAVPDVPVLEGFTRAVISGTDGKRGEGSAPDAKNSPQETASCGGKPLDFGRQYALAMSAEDLACCRDYFVSVNRDPSLAELRILDTYWSDHCRHTTFNTVLEDIEAGEAPPDLQKALDLYRQTRREVYGDEHPCPPPSLMDMAVIGAKALKKRGLIDDVDFSREINACTIKVNAEFSDGSAEPWLLLFKNETHNHPTEIEPFGGAATCLGGAIRDPLSGRAYVHQTMRISGGGDPRRNLEETLPGKLPQLKIAREAAAGYSSYGNQIGLATGQVAEFYHPDFTAKRMELGAVIGAVPQAWVRREEPGTGDLVILVGGRTGRDGIGGATGSSKVHTGESVETAGAEVQKGNAVEERKLQRLFRNPKVSALIKRCNDFGAGGVSVAVGELAAGLDIDLDAVSKKYQGLDGIELAISESQERMAVLVDAQDAEALIRYAAEENLEAAVIARVSSADEGTAHLRMIWRGKVIADLSRRFLNSNGAPRKARASLHAAGGTAPAVNEKAAAPLLPAGVLLDNLERELASLRSGSRRGLTERFDGSIGAASVLFPWGGKEQGTPECGMASLLPSLDKKSLTASLMSFGYDPEQSSRSPYEGAKAAIREALAKFCCLGGKPWKARLSLQEYFERPEGPESWGKPAAALLGALEAQLYLEVPAIGGKDSMSGTYIDRERDIKITVPPTLVAFAAGTAPAAAIRSGALSGIPGNVLLLLSQSPAGKDGDAGQETALPGDEWHTFKANMDALTALSEAGLVKAAYPVGAGGVAAALALMAFGNTAGIEVYAQALHFGNHDSYAGSVLVEIDGKDFEGPAARGILSRPGLCPVIAGVTVAEPVFRIVRNGAEGETEASPAEEENPEFDVAETHLAVLRRAYEYPLSQVYPQTSTGATAAETPEPPPGAAKIPAGMDAYFSAGITPAGSGPGKDAPRPKSHSASSPLVVLPVFPGTNCEWDMERKFRDAGARTRLVVFRNRSRDEIRESIGRLAEALGEAQLLALSGGFSAGDEPEGSGKFIANVLRAPRIMDAVRDLLERRQGLMLGICNGFQALIKLGLLPYGVYRGAEAGMPTLTFNRIGRHVSRMVRTRIMSVSSPWLSLEEPGTVHVIPVSHGEGRLVIGEDEAEGLFRRGQVAFCYADAEGRPGLAEPDNPNGSDFAIEGITSPDGKILGKMGHSERAGEYVHINIPDNKRQRIFEAGLNYFK